MNKYKVTKIMERSSEIFEEIINLENKNKEAIDAMDIDSTPAKEMIETIRGDKELLAAIIRSFRSEFCKAQMIEMGENILEIYEDIIRQDGLVQFDEIYNNEDILHQIGESVEDSLATESSDLEISVLREEGIIK